MRALLLATLFAIPAAAQEYTPPPPPPIDASPTQAPPNVQPQVANPIDPDYQAPAEPVSPQTAPLREPSYADRCFSYPAIWVEPAYHPVVVVQHSGHRRDGETHEATPVGSGNVGSGGDLNLGGGGGGDGKGLLILAVVAAALLPIIIYAIDGDAPPVVQQRYGCPSFTLDGTGGVDALPRSRALVPTVSGRFAFSFSAVGGDFAIDSVPGVLTGLSTHFLLRPPPKAHLEAAIAIGYRRMESGGVVRDGFDVGLPHRYVFWRDGLRTLGLEVRPSLLFGPRGVEASLEASLILPIIELLHLRAGGRVYSFGNDILWGMNAGLTFGI